MATTRRFAGMALAAACALLVSAPVASAGTQVRQYEAFGITLEGPGANTPRVGDLALNVVFANKRPGGKYTPRRLTRIRIDGLPLRCSDPGTPPMSSPVLDADIASSVKFTKAPAPATSRPKANRYAYRFAWGWGGFATGYFNGTIDKANGKGWPRAHGKFTITRYDYPPPGPSGCVTSGQIGWSIPKQCKRPGQSGDLPLCRFD